MKRFWAGPVVAGLLALLSGNAFAQGSGDGGAFHDKGRLDCSQCHTMHYSEDGAIPADAAAGGPFKRMVKNGNITDLCLTCHDTAGSKATFQAGGSTAPKVKGTVVNELPGGSFNYSYADAGKGHSPIGTGFAPEVALATAPGGNYPSATFTCSSCHGAHGPTSSYTNEFRNIKNKLNGVTVSGFILSTNAEEATLVTPGAAADQNAAIDATNHNVYKGELGAACGACHSNPDNSGNGFHGIEDTDPDVGNGTDFVRHPTGTNLATKHATYYGANSDYAYPIVTTSASATTTAEWALVATESKVFCLTCHKAHSTEYANGTRWNAATVQVSGAGCNKCHGK